MHEVFFLPISLQFMCLVGMCYTQVYFAKSSKSHLHLDVWIILECLCEQWIKIENIGGFGNVGQ